MDISGPFDACNDMDNSSKVATRLAPSERVKPRKTAARSAAPAEAGRIIKGQKWQIATGHAEILHVGKTLVQYRFIKTGMARGALEMKSIVNFAEALKTHKAKLVA